MKRYTLIISLIFITHFCHGQALQEILKQAEANYPLLKAKGYEVQARKDQVAFAKSTALPSLDAAYQLNYATYNNITGMAVGHGFVPISGPPSTTNTYDAVFGSVGGLLLNWEPFTFGQRKSRINSARAYQEYQQADQAQEVFQHQVKTANAYLDLVLTHKLVNVYSKNLERAQDNVRIVKSLTRSGLRPGTDTALFKAELSRARIELLEYEKLKQSQQLILSELLGGEQANYSIDSSYFKLLPFITVDTLPQQHPLIRLSMSRVLINQYEKKYVQTSMYPTLSFWGAAYARGSGIRYDGQLNSEDGLSFSRYNYGVGLILSVPLLRFANVRHQVNARESEIKAEQEKLNTVNLQLRKQNDVADVTLANALKIAHESPSFYESAEFSYRTLISRYNSGLVNYADLIQAQYVLIKSEADLKRAYLNAWKALLYKAAVQGDIHIFLNQFN
ncbi:TolC family protein [Dawidia soli]|uniref:TolC family protein n=1 Tax=Dawidia soli TaxID=2782352 RepID=A0AAP2D7U2_9BACT|nr:TolC family protein [Dawidia soli]MBT1686859.1 TolC family protein [Dawidia soli]